jgi:asparagine synthase (glutamine-hydrolysing)
MPGIWGLVGVGPKSDDLEALLQAMGERLWHHDFYRADLYPGDGRGPYLGRMTLGFVNTAPQPASNEDGSLLAVMEGEILDHEEHRRYLRTAGHDFRGDSHAELLLHGYEQSGQESFRDLHGSFAAAIWDGRRRQLVLVNDRFGMKPLYYARTSERLVFASEIKALLADPSVSQSLAPRGVAQFFAFGHLLGEETFFEAVKLLPAAGWLTFEADTGRLTLDPYWRLGAGHGEPRLRGAEALNRIDEAFGRAIERCTTGTTRLGLSLSGGLDSRTILAAIDTDRTPVTAVSLGMDGSIDVQSAGEMARLTRAPHHRYQLDGSFLADFEDHLRWMVHLTDGHHLCQCIVMPTLPLYRALGIEVLLRGHVGELMHMDKAYNYSVDPAALAIRDEAGLESWLWRRLRTSMTEGIDGPLFTPRFREMMEVLPRESLRECLGASQGIDPPVHRIWHLFLDQRVRRETALSMVEFGSLVETRLPFLDNELLDLLFRTEPGLKLGEATQAHIIRRRHPAFLDIANANTGVRVGAGRWARATGKARLRVLAKLSVRGYQPYERLGLWLRKDLLPVVKRLLLSGRCLSRGIFEPRAVESIVRQHANNEKNHTFLLMALMIFEQGQREFIDGDGPPARRGAAPLPRLEPAGVGTGR